MFKKTALFSIPCAFLLALSCAPQTKAQEIYPNPYGASSSGYAPSSGASGGLNTAYETRFSSMEDQIRALTGKLEQADYALRRMDQAMQRMQNDYEARLAKIETTPPPVATVQPAQQQPAPVAQQQPASQQTEANGQLGGLKVRGGNVTGAVNDQKASPLPSKPEDYGLNPQEAYDRALALLRQANYDEAERAFKAFIEKYPKDKQIENALYWHGETFYVRTKFNEAAMAFAEAFQQNPKGTKAPDALLKLGMSLAALGKTEDACTTYASVKKEFPAAPVTLRSRIDQERLRLKCK